VERSLARRVERILRDSFRRSKADHGQDPSEF